MKENGFIVKKARSKRHPAETITVSDYADDLALFGNTPIHAECLLYSQEQAVRGTVLSMNSDQTEFMCFKQDGAISTLNDKPLKLLDHFRYLSSNISFTENNVNIHIGKAKTVIDR